MDKRPIVDFIKSQSESQDDNGRSEEQTEKDAEKLSSDDPDCRPAGQINKLLERKRPKYLVFNIYKLRNLETHK